MSRHFPLAALVAIALVGSAGPAPAQQAAALPDGPRVVDAAWLRARIADPRIVVLHIEHGDYADGHLPGARAVAYDRITTRRGTLGSELPDREQLRATFAALGISDSTLVVVYAHEGPMATRALYTLAAIGHRRYALLDGGLDGWRRAGGAVTQQVPSVTPGTLTLRPGPAVVADAAWISERLGAGGLSLIDTRTDGEYNGTGNRSGMPSVGHLAGARQLQWEELFADGATQLKPRAELERMFAERVRPGDAVVTYCWVGYRASATWFIAQWLGYDARLYDGSYQDWSQRALPTRAGTTP
jgi:thiosulfate/3-mercaptopyruvate sulfurtransferase